MMLQRSLSWMAIFMLAFAGCPAKDDDTDDDATSDDDATGDDDTTGADDDTTAADDDVFVPETIEGEVLVELQEFNNGGGGTVSMGKLYATFYDIVTPASGGPVITLPETTDECVVSLFTLDDINAEDPGETVYQSAGTLTLASSGGSFDIDAIAAGTVVFYQYTLDAGTQMPYDATYSVRTEGDAFPEFYAQDSLQMPPELHLTLPTPSQSITLTGDYTVQWSGGGNKPVWLVARINSVQDYGELHCKVANDGEFTIPGKLISMLPPGGAGMLSLAHHDDTYIDVDGRWVKLSGGFAHDVLASTP